MASIREQNTRRYLMRFKPSLWEQLQDAAAKRNQDVSVLIRQGVARELEVADETEEPEASEIPLLGYIPAGEVAEVCPFPPDVTVRAPRALPENSYILHVQGDSMTTDDERSIPDGYFAAFCPHPSPPSGATVHVEFPRANGVHDCTCKVYSPNWQDGTVSFKPLNLKHKTKTVKNGEFVIRGVLVHAWDGKSA